MSKTIKLWALVDRKSGEIACAREKKFAKWPTSGIWLTQGYPQCADYKQVTLTVTVNKPKKKI